MKTFPKCPVAAIAEPPHAAPLNRERIIQTGRERRLLAIGVLGAATVLIGAARSNAPSERDARIALLQRRVDWLETRLAESRASASPTPPSTVRAPFTVVNGSGAPVMEVKENNGAGALLLYGSGGKPTIALWNDSAASRIDIRNGSSSRQITIGAGQQSALVTLSDGAGIENARASIRIGPDGQTTLQIYNAKHKSVVGLTNGPRGGGIIEVSEPGGEKRVEIGTQGEEGLGVVRTGPKSQCEVGGMLLPSSCIIGRKGG